jgi:peptidoglycan biosynthesis protein MviN/MurJ (putative lipid II flippase)
MAVLCAQTFEMAITLLMVRRELGMTRGDFSRLLPILKITGATLAAAVPTFAIKVMLGQAAAFLQIVIGSLCFGVFYLIAIFAVGCITQSERAQLRQIWKRYSPRTAAFFRPSPEQIGSGE